MQKNSINQHREGIFVSRGISLHIQTLKTDTGAYTLQFYTSIGLCMAPHTQRGRRSKEARARKGVIPNSYDD